jgi:hypothetical protein
VWWNPANGAPIHFYQGYALAELTDGWWPTVAALVGADLQKCKGFGPPK